MGLILHLFRALRGFALQIVTTDQLPELAMILRTRLVDGQGQDGLRLDPRQRATFDRLMDGLNRLPRPLMALGTFCLIGAALIDPVWFAARMEALAAMPEALWWLIGAVVSLYFGARLQTTGQEFQRELIDTIVRIPDPGPPTQAASPRVAETGADAALALAAETPSGNPALADWHVSTKAAS